MVMVGLGGVLVEVLGDAAFRICPIDRVDAAGMLDELRGAALLRGARGSAAVDRDALVDVLLMVGGEAGLLSACGDDVAEVDINPLIVGAQGAVAVDARFILAR
jgi:acyl-CoA synthetase (NDP forming)